MTEENAFYIKCSQEACISDILNQTLQGTKIVAFHFIPYLVVKYEPGMHTLDSVREYYKKILPNDCQIIEIQKRKALEENFSEGIDLCLLLYY